MPSITKDRISSPLEAGPSLLDVKQLPPQLTSALDYVSSRLSRKRLHLSLIVIRKDVQLPISPPASPPLPSNNNNTTSSNSTSTSTSTSTSPARSLFTRQLSKHSSNASLSSSSASTPSSFSRTIYPSLPASPKSLMSTSPVSSTSSESSLSPCTSPEPPNPYGISLLHATTLTPKAEKILRQTIGKAEKKFGIGSGWLSSQPLSTSSTCAQTNDLIHRSLQQNETLFSSAGLTLYALDHIYVFKCYLHAYSRELTSSTLTTAVDELRRLVLAQPQPQHGSISKGQLMRAYAWLGISLAALVDVNEGYKKTYGGEARCSGVDVSPPLSPSPTCLPLSLQTSFMLVQRPNPRRPKLSLALNTDPEKEIRVGESARGVEIDGAEPLSPTLRGLREDRGPHRRGPQTPNGFEDITPVTKGEWCYLMVGEGWKGGRTVAVETC